MGRSLMKIVVKDYDGGPHCNSVYVIRATKNTILLAADFDEKRPEVNGYSDNEIFISHPDVDGITGIGVEGLKGRWYIGADTGRYSALIFMVKKAPEKKRTAQLKDWLG